MTKQELFKKCASIYGVKPSSITDLRSDQDISEARALAQLCLKIAGLKQCKIAAIFKCTPSAVSYNMRKLKNNEKVLSQAKKIMEGETYVR